MNVLFLILYLVAGLMFLGAAVGVTSSRLNLMAAGLLAWVLVDVIALADRMAG